MSSDELTSPAQAEDHCLVHHFIRTHGRRPTADELADLVGTRVAPPAPRVSDAARGPSRLHAMRREVASLVSRL
jgi:hypothetical protein